MVGALVSYLSAQRSPGSRKLAAVRSARINFVILVCIAKTKVRDVRTGFATEVDHWVVVSRGVVTRPQVASLRSPVLP